MNDREEVVQQQQSQQPPIGSSRTPPSCAPCVQLLQQVLMDSTSRPRQILESLVSMQETNHKEEVRHTAAHAAANEQGNRRVRLTADGVQVLIPTEAAAAAAVTAAASLKETSPPQTPAPPLTSGDRFASLQRLLSMRPNILGSTPVATSSSSRNPGANETSTEWMTLQCRPCDDTGPEAHARAFVMGPTPLSVVVCTNRLEQDSKAAAVQEVEEILTHELIHVHDVRKLQLDLQDCDSLAYSEVRAAAQAECASQQPPPLAAGPFGTWQAWRYQSCVRSKAETATKNLFPNASACVQRVFERALQDERPFQKTTASDTPRAPPVKTSSPGTPTSKPSVDPIAATATAPYSSR